MGIKFKIGFIQEKRRVTRLQSNSQTVNSTKKGRTKKWLKDVSSVPLQQSLKALDTAFKRFFKKQGGYPKFKRKSNRQSITYQPNAYSWSDGQLTLAKMKQPLKIKWSRRFSGTPKQVTVSKDPSGRYFVSFLVEEELTQWDKNDSSIGIDLGIKLEKSKSLWGTIIEVEISRLEGTRNIAIVMNATQFKDADDIDYFMTNVELSIVTSQWVVDTYSQRNWVERL